MTSRSNYTVLLVAMAALFSTMVARLSISPVIPDIVDAYHVSKGVVGLGLTGLWAAYGVMQFPSGLLAERYGGRRILLLAVLLTGVGSLLIAVAPSFPLFVAFLLFLGAGAGLYYSVGSALLTNTFENTGLALGAHSSALPIAGLVTPVAASAIGVRYGWRPAVLLGAVIALPVFVVATVWWRAPEAARSGSAVERGVDWNEFVSLMTRPPILYTTLIAILTSYAYQAFTSFFPTFLVEYRKLSIGEASVAFGAVFVITALCLPVLGTLSDRYSRDAVLTFALSLCATGFGVLLLAEEFAVAMLGVGLLGVGMSWGGALNSRFMDHLSPEERNTGFGLVRTVYLLVGSLGSLGTGVLADALGWIPAYGSVIALLGVGILIIVTNAVVGTDF